MDHKNQSFIKSFKEFEESLEEFESVRNSLDFNFLKSSSIAFGNHKSGSTMLQRFLEQYSNLITRNFFNKELKEYNNILKDTKFFSDKNKPDRNTKSNDYLYINFNAKFIRKLFDDISLVNDIRVTDKIAKFILKTKPSLYTGFRGYTLKGFLKYKSQFKRINLISLIRDPRDIAVSSYYSYFFSHNDTKNTWLKEMKTKSIPDLNSYVLNTGIIEAIYELGVVSSFLQPNLTVYKYEDFWFNKKDFCIDVINKINLPLDKKLFDQAFYRTVEPPSDSKIVQSGHFRNGNPGEYKEKLSKDTINLINEKYKTILDLYNYC